MKKYLLQRIIGEIVSIVSQLLLFEAINYIRKKLYERKKRKKHWLRMYYMINVGMSGWEAKGLAATGGVVSPSHVQKKLSSELTVMVAYPRRYGK